MREKGLFFHTVTLAVFIILVASREKSLKSDVGLAASSTPVSRRGTGSLSTHTSFPGGRKNHNTSVLGGLDIRHQYSMVRFA